MLNRTSHSQPLLFEGLLNAFLLLGPIGDKEEIIPVELRSMSDIGVTSSAHTQQEGR